MKIDSSGAHDVAPMSLNLGVVPRCYQLLWNGRVGRVPYDTSTARYDGDVLLGGVRHTRRRRWLRVWYGSVGKID